MSRYVMGTFLSVCIEGHHKASLTQIFLDDVQRLEALLSIYRPESDLSRINRAAGHHAVQVSAETFQLIQEALRFSKKSDGAFDPTLQPLGYQRVQLDAEARTVFLPMMGMRLDLGGIGKGFALDRALNAVLAAGSPESVSADFGGQLLFWHRAGSFEPETIFIEDPVSRRAIENFPISSNCSVSTSSNAERPGHLLNPRAAGSVQAEGSVTVVASTATEAEALSTAFFIQGCFGLHQLL